VKTEKNMRIDQTTPVTETAQSDRVAGSTGQSNSASQASQAQSQSEVSLQHDELRAKLEQTPDIREDRVASLQKAMQDGTYQVSNQDLANAIFNTLVQKK
jgi:flagellar biosynthesis anti-sigma factor FlgM